MSTEPFEYRDDDPAELARWTVAPGPAAWRIAAFVVAVVVILAALGVVDLVR